MLPRVLILPTDLSSTSRFEHYNFMQAVIDLLYDTSLVTSGFTVDSPKAFADRIYDMIAEVTGSERFRSSSSQNGAPVEAEILETESSSDPWKQ